MEKYYVCSLFFTFNLKVFPVLCYLCRTLRASAIRVRLSVLNLTELTETEKRMRLRRVALWKWSYINCAWLVDYNPPICVCIFKRRGNEKTWRLNHDVHGACEHNSVSPEERPSNEETVTLLKLINETNRSDFQMVFPLFEVWLMLF